MCARIVLLLLAATINHFIVTEVDARVVGGVSTALGCQPSNAWLLGAKATDRHAWVVALPLAEWIYFGFKAEVTSLVIAQIATTLSLTASNSGGHVPITAHETVGIVLDLTT